MYGGWGHLLAAQAVETWAEQAWSLLRHLWPLGSDLFDICDVKHKHLHLRTLVFPTEPAPSSFYQTAAPYTGYLGEILETQSRFCVLYSLRAIQQQVLEAFIFQVYPVLDAFSLSLLLLPGPCYHLLPPGLGNQLVNYSFLPVFCNILYCSVLLLNNNQEWAFKNINGISISLALYDQAPPNGSSFALCPSCTPAVSAAAIPYSADRPSLSGRDPNQ